MLDFMRLVTIVLLLALSPQSLRAQIADELVTFEAAPYVRGQLQRSRAIEHDKTAVAPTRTIEAYLSKPAGDGPFPAVIYLHGCTGLAMATRERFAEMLTGWGFVSLAVDSFTTRGIKEACDRPMPDRAADAWGALLYLSKQSFVDRGRIALVGSSQGAIVTLSLASMRHVKLFDVPDNTIGFQAAVAFYPLCSVASEQLAIPALILIGELDDWTPVSDCQRWIKLRDGKGAPVKFVVYPGAYHAFDAPGFKDGAMRFGHWLKYDADAARDATTKIHDFLASHLSR